MKPARGRLTIRDQLMASKRSSDMYAALADKPPMSFTDVRGEPLIKPVRKRAAAKPSGVPLERDVLVEVIAALRAHPSVAWVCRMNSGTFKEGNRYVRANSQRGMSDIIAMTIAGRLMAVECKRPGGKLEPHQAEFLGTINANGGLAFMATCGEDVRKIMDERCPQPKR